MALVFGKEVALQLGSTVESGCSCGGERLVVETWGRGSFARQGEPTGGVVWRQGGRLQCCSAAAVPRVAKEKQEAREE